MLSYIFTANNIGLMISLASILATRIFDIYDRRDIAKKLAARVMQDAEELRRVTALQTSRLSAAIVENTHLTKEGIVASKEAAEKANTANEKIIELDKVNKGILENLTK